MSSSRGECSSLSTVSRRWSFGPGKLSCFRATTFVTNIVGNAELGITDPKHMSEFEKTYKQVDDQTKPKVGDVVVYVYAPKAPTWFEHMALVVQANGETKVIGISKKGGKILLTSVKGQWDPGSSAT